MTMIARSVQHLQPTHLENLRPGFSTRSLRAPYETLMDPFVSLDHFWMDRAIFPPHPHAGFSAVTYMLEESAGTFVNQWSMGEERDLIGPGSIHWTQAGSGMMHEEVPFANGGGVAKKMCVGIQMFVKQPAAMELAPPAAFHVNAPDVPVWTSNDEGTSSPTTRVRVLAGTYRDQSAADRMPVANENLTYLDVHLAAGATFDMPTTDTAFIFTIKTGDGGLISVDARGVETVIGQHVGAFFAPDGDLVSLRAKSSGAQFLFCGGVPNREPLVAGGSFMMTTRERIDDARRRYQSGAMGHIEPLNVDATKGEL
jgi:redox-sensitive bicupin YhaK (pirin superfamily)